MKKDQKKQKYFVYGRVLVDIVTTVEAFSADGAIRKVKKADKTGHINWTENSWTGDITIDRAEVEK